MYPAERTLFQEGLPRNPLYDIHTDLAVVYGIGTTLIERVAGWRAGGYHVGLMTGLAWGNYEDYVLGQWDGNAHWDDAQYRANGKPVLHGPNIPYMVPTTTYAAYLENLLLQAVAAGVEAIYLEEPEFWTYSNYGVAFELAWADFYGVPYRDPEVDAQAFAMASHLKRSLYRDLIDRLTAAAQRASAARPIGPIPTHIATHSLINYAYNRIVAPNSTLRDIPTCSGIIVQVWGFTARGQVFYEGRRGERVIEVAFLEYSAGLELVRGLNRQVWFLADPVEDRPTNGWDYYRAGYEMTITTALLYPEVGGYEVMPWPSRVFTGRYPRTPNGPPGTTIPAAYATEVLAIANALAAMPESPVTFSSGTQGIGVLIADSMMYRRGGPQQNDPFLSSFFGLALPPIIAGMPARCVSMETLTSVGVPTGMRVLLLSYDGMTPPDAASHGALAAWVRSGNALILFGAGDDPYATLPGWWNDQQGGTGPLADLYQRLGLPPTPAAGLNPAGAGVVLIEPRSPIDLAQDSAGATLVRAHIRDALAGLGPGAPAYAEQSYMLLQRGKYVIAAAPREAPGVDPATPVLTLSSTYVSLFDGSLPVLNGFTLLPGQYIVLIDLATLDHTVPQVVAAGTRISGETATGGVLHFRASGPQDTTAAVRLLLPHAPSGVAGQGVPISFTWDPASFTALIQFPNAPNGVDVTVM